MPFDPDQYLKQKLAAAPTPQATPAEGFNPDKYLAEKTSAQPAEQNRPSLLGSVLSGNAQGAIEALTPSKESADAALSGAGQGLLAGYLPQVQAKAQPVTDRIYNLVNRIQGKPQVEPAPWSQLTSNDENYVKARDTNIANIDQQKSEHPYAYGAGLVGGALTQGAMLPIGPAESLLGGVAKGAAVGAAQGAIQNPGDTKGQVSMLQLPERAGGAAVGGAVGGVVGGIGGAISQIGKAGQTIGATEENAGEIAKATRALGAEPTVGQLSSSPTLKGIESSLGQAPGRTGDAVRDGINQVQEAVRNNANKLAEQASKKTSFEVGEQIKSDIVAQIGEQLDPVKAAYQSLGKETPSIKVDSNRLMKIGDNLLNHDYSLFESDGLPNKIASQLQNVKSVDQLQTLRSTLGRLQRDAYAQGDSSKGIFLGDAIKSLNRLEQSSVTRASMEAMTGGIHPDKILFDHDIKLNEGQVDTLANAYTSGKEHAQQMIQDLKFARKGYRELMQNIGEMAGFTKIKGQRFTPSQFIDKLESVPSEQLATRMFQTKNVAGLRAFKQAMPEQFESLRQLQLANIVNKASTGGEINPTTMVKAIESYSPEVQREIFNPAQLETIKNMKTVINSYPSKIGPSGTPQGMEFKEWGKLLSPSYWMDQVGREAQLKVYQTANKVIKGGAGAVADETGKALSLLGKGTQNLVRPAVQMGRQ